MKYDRRNFRAAWIKFLAIAIFIVSLSAFHAYRNSQVLLQESLPPPLYNIRFTLHPSLYVVGQQNLGLQPLWVVTYATPMRNYGTAVVVSLLGTIKGTGTPVIVAEAREQSKRDLEKLNRAFARADAAIRVGMKYSNAAAILGSPNILQTNGDGTLDAIYHYMPPTTLLSPVTNLTNGITLHISNGKVLYKTYGFTSAP